MKRQTNIALFLIALLLAPCCIGSLSAQQSDNYRNRLRNANVKVEETNLPIVFINVGGKTILGNEIAWGIYTRTFIWPLYYYASNYDENS